MEMGKLNVYYINSDLKIGNTVTSIASAYLSNATEDEFKGLLDSFLADNELNSGLFMSYVANNGYYCKVLDGEILTPRG
ncbi:hypothetical protein [Methanobacterium sp.]|uniref:hypothetical protein n=1 Tax=Methanobacterium sp. TaxID=2164 RepID=UPI003C72398D